MSDKAIEIKCQMEDKQGLLIPKGVRENLTIQIIDEIAYYWFSNPKITKRFCEVEIKLQKEKGEVKTIYDEVSKKGITVYKDLNKEQIKKKIQKQLKIMGARR